MYRVEISPVPLHCSLAYTTACSIPYKLWSLLMSKCRLSTCLNQMT